MSPLTLCSANSLPSGTHSVQSMHSSGSIAGKFAPSWKQSIGHTSTQSVYLHLMHLSVTTWVMITSSAEALDGELDVVLFRKLGASGNPEFAIARWTSRAPCWSTKGRAFPELHICTRSAATRPDGRGQQCDTSVQRSPLRRSLRVTPPSAHSRNRRW